MKTEAEKKRLPEKALLRYTFYLSFLVRTSGISQREFISSAELSQYTGISAALIRKDLALLQQGGVRGKGYAVEKLKSFLAQLFHVAQKHPALLVGLGHLGTALVRYEGFAQHGFEIVGVYDKDPKKIGRKIGRHIVRDIASLEKDNRLFQAKIAILAVPASEAQEVAEKLVKSKIKCILNFAPTFLRCGKAVMVRYVDLARELQLLAYYIS